MQRLLQTCREKDIGVNIAYSKVLFVEVEKYLYELQGAQRFGDNNRVFLIITDTKNPEKSWELKRNFSLAIKKPIQRFQRC